MKERPILFNGEMVQAILSGRKTQTRRIVKPYFISDKQLIKQCDDGEFRWWIDGAEKPHGAPIYSKQGKVGDQLWVRETFATLACGSYEPEKPSLTGAYQEVRYLATDRLAGSAADVRGYNWRPSIHMPRWASRIDLLITGIRVERLNSLTNADAKAEGYPAEREIDGGSTDPWLWFRDLWDGIYPDNTFKVNPWVWVIEFERVGGDL